jgi:hypothetical protein
MADFRFPADVRPFVESLAKLLYFANARDTGKWAWQSSDPAHNGVFGAAMTTVEMIIREVCGAAILEAIGRSRYGWNFGGNGSFLLDIEVAVQTAIETIAQEKWDAGFQAGCAAYPEKVPDQEGFSEEFQAGWRAAFNECAADESR